MGMSKVPSRYSHVASITTPLVWVARTTESSFHRKIINMLVSGNKGPFEKCRNAIFSDFDANWRKISKLEKTFARSLPAILSLLSIRYVVLSGSADFKFAIQALFMYTFNCDYIHTINKHCSFR